MFWGLIMEPGRCYSQKIKASFHVSMAALDISNSSNEPTQLMCLFEDRNYLLCTLNKTDKIQCPLDLNFEVNSKVSFATNGKSHVHLTGYLIYDTDEGGLDDEEAEEEEEDEDEDIETVALSKSQLKRLTKQSAVGAPPQKKTKKNAPLHEDVEEEESDDSDFNLDASLLNTAEDGSEEEVENEDSSDDNDDVDEEASEEEEEEEEVVPKKPVKKQNGVAPKPEKKKQADVPKKSKEQPKAQPKKVILKGGIIVEDLKEGKGDAVAKPGRFVQVYYEGRLKDTKKMFDSTTKGPGFSFRLGKGEVIKGWDTGVAGMKVGGKRRITCPPNAAYGAKGSPPVIPPNSTLVFDVELKKIS